jgi:DegV family protein with EDD domain
MPRYHIVTDSGTQLGDFIDLAPLPVTVIPTDITSAAPRLEAYIGVFESLARTHDGIVCIVPSRQLSDHWSRARSAARQIAGGCPIHIIDSQSLSAGQGLLTHYAAKVLATMPNLDEMERVMRGAISRAYLMLYIEQVEMLPKNRILNEQHSLFSAMLSVKPILTLDEGALKAVGKVRSRTIALEQIVEFAAEFSAKAHTVILHDVASAEMGQRLRERLAGQNGGQIDTIVYNQTLTRLVGAGAAGIAILEHLEE